LTAQNLHERVQYSPITMNDAVRNAQHSLRFGQCALWHTL
jgi:hypothetical protein